MSATTERVLAEALALPIVERETLVEKLLQSLNSEKPSPEIFQEALRQARARPEESIHVGDDFDADYRGAEAIGMVGVLLNRDGIAPKNVRSVASLGELPGLLGGETEKV